MLAALLASAPGLPSPNAEPTASLLQPDAAVKPWGHGHRPHGHNPHRHSPHSHAPFSCEQGHTEYSSGSLYDLREAVTIMQSAYVLEERVKERVGYSMASMASKLSGKKEYMALLNIAPENRTADQHTDVEMLAPLIQGGDDVADAVSAASGFTEKLIESDPGKGGYGYCGTYNGKKVLVFCGSSDSNDWTDANFQSYRSRTTSLGGIRDTQAGQGFADQYDGIMSGAMRTCATSGVSQLRIYGHSLGGALSEIAAAEMAERGIAVELFNAGSARGLAEADADYFQGKVYQPTTAAFGFPPAGNIRAHRMANYNDPVPCLPTSAVMGFKHFGNLNYIQDPCVGACGMRVQIWDQNTNPAINLVGAFSNLLIDFPALLRSGQISAVPNHMLSSTSGNGYWSRLISAETPESAHWIAQGAGCAANGVYDVVAGAASGVVSGVAGGVSGAATWIAGGVSGMFGDKELNEMLLAMQANKTAQKA